MKKNYKMANLGCASCAAKMEAKIKKIDGVDDVNINFMYQKITVEGDESKWDTIMAESSRICKKIEAKCQIVM